MKKIFLILWIMFIIACNKNKSQNKVDEISSTAQEVKEKVDICMLYCQILKDNPNVFNAKDKDLILLNIVLVNMFDYDLLIPKSLIPDYYPEDTVDFRFKIQYLKKKKWQDYNLLKKDVDYYVYDKKHYDTLYAKQNLILSKPLNLNNALLNGEYRTKGVFLYKDNDVICDSVVSDWFYFKVK